MRSDSEQPKPEEQLNGVEQQSESNRSTKPLLTMCELVYNRPYAVLESVAGDAKVDKIQVAVWRNHVLEFSRTEQPANHTISLQLLGSTLR